MMIAHQLFEPTLEKICQHIGAVLAEPDVGTISHLFLVGGFAESPLLQVTTAMITNATVIMMIK